MTEQDHEQYMRLALAEAEGALRRGDGAVGAVIVHDGVVIGKGSSSTRSQRKRIAHAEMEAISSCHDFLYERGAACVLYTTVEPCLMCLGAIAVARIGHVVFGVSENQTDNRHAVENFAYIQDRLQSYTGGVLGAEAQQLIDAEKERPGRVQSYLRVEDPSAGVFKII